MAQDHIDKKITFDTQRANKEFDLISIKLSTQNLRFADLNSAVEQLEALQSQAKVCVTKSQEHLTKITELLKASQLDEQAAKQNADYQYLLKQKTSYQKELSECR